MVFTDRVNVLPDFDCLLLGISFHGPYNKSEKTYSLTVKVRAKYGETVLSETHYFLPVKMTYVFMPIFFNSPVHIKAGDSVTLEALFEAPEKQNWVPNKISFTGSGEKCYHQGSEKEGCAKYPVRFQEVLPEEPRTLPKLGKPQMRRVMMWPL